MNASLLFQILYCFGNSQPESRRVWSWNLKGNSQWTNLPHDYKVKHHCGSTSVSYIFSLLFWLVEVFCGWYCTLYILNILSLLDTKFTLRSFAFKACLIWDVQPLFLRIKGNFGVQYHIVVKWFCQSCRSSCYYYRVSLTRSLSLSETFTGLTRRIKNQSVVYITCSDAGHWFEKGKSDKEEKCGLFSISAS